MAAMLAVVLAGVLLALPRDAGQGQVVEELPGTLRQDPRRSTCSPTARIFMFGSRDVWFVVGLPVFLYANGWRYMAVAGFLAAWTIGYGGVQALAPSVIRRSPDGLSREVPEARLWGAVLTASRSRSRVLLASGPPDGPDLVVVVGLAIFGFAFAVISSLHSYLILAYAGSEKAAEDVGFYYAANAAGRLIGILLSGVLTQAGGMPGLPVGVGGDAGDLLGGDVPVADAGSCRPVVA